MRILNFGSLNIDYVYRVDSFIRPGETKASKSLSVNCGGKGLNQSVAAAQAGCTVLHAGKIGRDGAMLREKLTEKGVDVRLLEATDGLCGNAIIQVDDAGQNCILLFGGTNRELTEEMIEKTLDAFGSEGVVLMQNETNLVGTIIERAHARGLKTALNAAPMDKTVAEYPLDKLDYLFVNEVEGSELAGTAPTAEEIVPVLTEKYPGLDIVLTLGKNGAVYVSGGKKYRIGSCTVNAVDTTAAGDTFTGFFLGAVLSGKGRAEALRLATAASAICVTRPGAADSIPTVREVEETIASGKLNVPEVTEA
ncbi:MAG: ribokinase [Clostridia bacterium]|nr:ribokinase [Clostridia bacterium]